MARGETWPGARVVAAGAIMAALVAVPAEAAAPAPGGAEEPCTVAKMEKPGVECVTCEAATHADPEACDRERKGTGYLAECRAAGSERWTEVWCRPRAVAPPAVGATPPRRPKAAPVTAAKGPAAAAPDVTEAPTDEGEADTGKKLNRQAAAAKAGREKSGCAGGGARGPLGMALALFGLLAARGRRRRGARG